MSKDEIKDNCNGNGNGITKDAEGVTSFLNWIWNPDTKEFLGRNGSSWAKVGVFYLIFYALLALFWALMLKIFMTTISFERPKWVMEDSLIGTSPGLSYRPSPKMEKLDSTLIQFRPSNNASYHHWVEDIKKFLKPYKERYEIESECRSFPSRKDKCPFLPTLSQQPCGANFGYDSGSPCVLIKLNRIFNWKPSPYRSLDDINNDLARNPKSIKIVPTIGNNELGSGEGIISVQCEGENAADKEKLSKIEYWPKQGFPAEYYPYTKQENYLSPFVLVKFNRPATGKAINIECIAMDKKIKINRYDSEGAVRFQLLIDD